MGQPLLLLFTFAALFGKVSALEGVKINIPVDTSYLPYKFTTTRADFQENVTIPQFHRVQVLEQHISSSDDGSIIISYNPELQSVGNARFNLREYPSFVIQKDHQVKLYVTDWEITNRSQDSTSKILGVGYRNDTAYVFNLDPLTGYYFENMLLEFSIHSSTVEEVRPFIILLLVENNACDARNEVFAYLSSNTNVRILYCLEKSSLQIKWSLPVSSVFRNKDDMYANGDSANPSLIFVTYNPKNQVADSIFDDNYSYLTVVNSHGIVVRNSILAEDYAKMVHLRQRHDRMGFYLTHATSLNEAIDFDSTDVPPYFLSKLNHKGEHISSTGLAKMPIAMWIMPYRSLSHGIYLKFKDNSISIYDSSLQLLSSATPSRIGRYLGEIQLNAEGDKDYVFSDGIYSLDNAGLDKIVHFPITASNYEILSTGNYNKDLHIALNTWNEYVIGEIHKRSLLELAAVFYHRNISYIIALSSAIFTCLILLAVFSRWKAKKDLRIVRLEQDALIAQEKYKQAKAIAGGFAHEIRNALFPADGLLTKLRHKTNPSAIETKRLRKYHKDTHAAVSRAIGITELISSYTKLDSEYQPEPCDLVRTIQNMLEANQSRINSQGIIVLLDGSENIFITANRQQVEMVINNLLLNSLDALKNASEPTIRIGIGTDDKTVEMLFSDNGEGIGKSDIDRIFEAFYSTKPNAGMGLGLSMVKKIVELYGGSISVSSNPGEDTEFKIVWQRSK